MPFSLILGGLLFVEHVVYFWISTDKGRELSSTTQPQRVPKCRRTAWTESVRTVCQSQGLWKRRADLPKPQSLLETARSIPAESWQEVTWRQGSKGPLKSRFAAVPVQPSPFRPPKGAAEPASWLLIEWPEGAAEPENYWISNLPEKTSLQELVYWAKLRWYIEQNYQQLKDQLGLDHFEGRSWRGWHHHVTLTMLAFHFLTLETLRVKKNFWVDPPTSTTGDTEDLTDALGILPAL